VPLRIRRLRSTKISPGPLRRGNSSSRQFDPVRSPRKKVILGRRSRREHDASTAFPRRRSSGCSLVSCPPETGDPCRGRYSLAPTHPLGLFVHRVNDLSPGLTRLRAIGEGRATPASDARRVPVAAALRRGARVDSRCTCSKKGTARSGCERFPAVRTSRRWGALQPRDDRDYMDTWLPTAPRSSKSLLGGRSRRPGAVPRAEEARIRSTGIGCYFDDPVHEGVRHLFARLAELLPLHGRWCRRGQNGSRRYPAYRFEENDELPDIRLRKSMNSCHT